MTEQAPEKAPQSPAPGAAPVPDFPHPAAPPRPAAAPAGDLSSRAAALEAELAEIRAQAVTGAKTELRVLPPHVQFTAAGVTVGAEPTAVPVHAVGPLMSAAAAAGVTIKEA